MREPGAAPTAAAAGNGPEEPAVTVVGIGDDGWDGLCAAAREAVRGADVVVGGPRHLALLPPGAGGAREPWPSPFTVAPVAAHAAAGRRVCVLASGDPMFHGAGVSLVRDLGAGAVRVLPRPSSLALACARLGWAEQHVTVVSAVGRPVAAVAAALHPGARVLVLSADGATPAGVADLLDGLGWGPSAIAVLEHLGGPAESAWYGTAAALRAAPGRRFAALNVVAVEAAAEPGTPVYPRVPGLPDDAYDTDGQLTKREVRAVTLSALAPAPGRLLWDVGAGSGSIAVEWMRTHPECRAVAVEPRPDRAARVRANAERLGVPGLVVVTGRAPDALAGLPRPDAVFVGGGLTAPGVVERCWDALRDGGRLVANAVVAETEAELLRHRAALGGDLIRLQVQRAEPVGRFTGWRPLRAVTQWTAVKPAAAPAPAPAHPADPADPADHEEDPS